MFSVVHDFNFLIIDACRNNPFYSRWGRPKGPGNQGLASTRPPRGTMIAYAAEENEVAIDGINGENSPFTASLLNYLAIPEMNIYQLLHSVQQRVEEITDGNQIPSWEGYPRNADIALNPSPHVVARPTPTILPLPPDISLSDTSANQPTTNRPSEPTLISAATGVNYQPLRDALVARDFELAEEITSVLMLRAAGRELEGWLWAEDKNNFPCEDLNIIDQLWITNSNGKFGFSVQRQIYQSLGGTTAFDEAVFERFHEEIGWRQNGDYVLHFLSTFSLEAPPGHLPRTRVGFMQTPFSSVSWLGLNTFPSCKEL